MLHLAQLQRIIASDPSLKLRSIPHPKKMYAFDLWNKLNSEG